MQRKRCRFPIERHGPTSSPAKTAQSSRMRKRSKIKIQCGNPTPHRQAKRRGRPAVED
jgi:hypothetical protein